MNEIHEELTDILRKEVKPALGCTGPTAISYAVSVARDIVGGSLKSIEVIIDKDMCAKNDDVGIPGTSQLGCNIAAALGAICGDSEAGLEVLRNVTPEDEIKAQKFAEESVIIKPDWNMKTVGLYIEAIVNTDNGTGRAIIAKTHTNVILKELNGEVLFKADDQNKENLTDETKAPIRKYEIKDFYEFAKNVPFESIAFLQEAVDLNMKLADSDLTDNSSIGFAKAFGRIKGDKATIRAKTITCAAATARMEGKNLAAMGCATSGNVGITASLPLVAIAEVYEKNQEVLLRGIAFSYLLTIYIKNIIGRLSAMCSCVSGSSSGIAAAMTFMLGGTLEQTKTAIQNMIPNIFGVVCDGARTACALKLTSSIGVAIECAYLALDNISVPANQGVVGKTADETLLFLGKIAKEGMVEVDNVLCKALYGRNHKI